VDLNDFHGRLLDLLHLPNSPFASPYVEQIDLCVRACEQPTFVVTYIDVKKQERYTKAFEWTPFGAPVALSESEHEPL
jgi:hypothetical protein